MPRKPTQTPKKQRAQKGGRPSEFTPELAESICEVIANRGLINDAFAIVPRSTLYRWISEHPEFREQITRAQEVGYEKAKDKGYKSLNKFAPVNFKAAASLIQCVQNDERLLIERRKVDKPPVTINNNVSVVNVEHAKGFFAKIETLRKASMGGA